MKELQISTSTKYDYLLITLGFVVLFVCSIFFAKERTIFTDTSIYLCTVADSGKIFIATNRFISVLSEILPLLGVTMGLSLKMVMYLYSFNCILIPAICAWSCIKFFKDSKTAWAILLFYIIMGAWTFYYPVSEFQMGLALLLFYHSFIIWYFNKIQKNGALFIILSLLFVITIIFSHPLALYVFFAWLFWIGIRYESIRKHWKWILLPVVVAVLSHIIKEKFFQSQVGATLYDQQRKDGLKYFSLPVKEYFHSLLTDGAYKAILSDYFLLPVLMLAMLVYFFIKRKWLQGLYFGGIVFAFWLLVSVSFRDWPYNHYTEHLYQPVPFFIALIFASSVNEMIRNKALRYSVLSLILLISLSKIQSNHAYFRHRLNVYEMLFKAMDEKHIVNATIKSEHVMPEINYSYWASKPETMLLSGIKGRNFSKTIVVDGNVADINTALEKPDKNLYFKNRMQPFVSLDSVYTQKELQDIIAKAKWD